LVVLEKIRAIIDELAPKDSQYSSLITFIKYGPGHSYSYAINCSKISRDFVWQPKENFDIGLLKTVQYYLNSSAWLDSVCTGTYQSWIKQNYQTR
jgi:dTDP-glucose 4,6-dehydratase